MSILKEFNPHSFKASPDNPVPSPCIKVCKLNALGMCEGCFRSLDEIRVWSSASSATKLEIWHKVKLRFKHAEIAKSHL